MSEISKICQKIRGYLYNIPENNFLGGYQENFFQFCVCLDTIEDVELTIETFLESKIERSVGESYLRIYGCLQALFLQQDAVHDLMNCINCDFNPINNISLKTIRDCRNFCVGHPTNKKIDNGSAYVSINRGSIENYSFRVLKHFSNCKDLQTEEINLLDLIKAQRKELHNVLVQALNILYKGKKEHRMKFRTTKLGKYFEYTDYNIEKILLATIDGPSAQPIDYFITSIKEAISKFKNDLLERGELDILQNLKLDLRLSEHAINSLDNFFTYSEDSIPGDTAIIFASYLRDSIENLKENAEEIDDQYSSDPDEDFA